jgi:hypothetical protein
MRRRAGLGALMLLMLTLIIGPAARSQEAVTADQIKMGFLFRFVQLVDWPTNAFSSDAAPLTIGVMGNDKFATELASLLKDKKAHNRSFDVKKLAGAADAANFHVVFIADGDGRRAAQFAEATHKKPVLLVGEHDEFLKNGGMINIVQDERQKQMRFDIAPKNAEQATLTFSSHLLRLARNKTGGSQ